MENRPEEGTPKEGKRMNGNSLRKYTSPEHLLWTLDREADKTRKSTGGKEEGPTVSPHQTHPGRTPKIETGTSEQARGTPGAAVTDLTSRGRGQGLVPECTDEEVKLGQKISLRHFTARRERKWKIKRRNVKALS